MSSKSLAFRIIQEPQPTAQEAGIPEDPDLPDGVFAFRFWTGAFANKPAAIVVDPHSNEIIFIHCLKYFYPFGTSVRRVRMKTDQIRRIEQATDRGIAALRIYTPQGFVEVYSGAAYDARKHDGTPSDATLKNFDQLREYLLANCPGDPWLHAAKKPWVARLVLGISGGIAIAILAAAILHGAGMKDARVLFFAVLAAFFVSTIILIQIAAWLRCWFGTSSASSGDNTPSPQDSDSP